MRTEKEIFDKLNTIKVMELNHGLNIRIMYDKDDLQKLMDARKYSSEDEAFTDIVSNWDRNSPNATMAVSHFNFFVLYLAEGIVSSGIKEQLVPLTMLAREITKVKQDPKPSKTFGEPVSGDYLRHQQPVPYMGMLPHPSIPSEPWNKPQPLRPYWKPPAGFNNGYVPTGYATVKKDPDHRW